MNVYINAKEFKNDDMSLLFGKDLITVEELVDKLYEIVDMFEERNESIEELEEEVRMLRQELSAVKNGYRPDNDDSYYENKYFN